LSEDPVSGNVEDPSTLDAYAYGVDDPYGEPDPSGMATAAQIGGLDLDSPTALFADPFARPGYYLVMGISENGVDVTTLWQSLGIGTAPQAVGVISEQSANAIARGASTSFDDVLSKAVLDDTGDSEFEQALDRAGAWGDAAKGIEGVGVPLVVAGAVMDYLEDVAAGDSKLYALGDATSRGIGAYYGAAEGCDIGGDGGAAIGSLFGGVGAIPGAAIGCGLGGIGGALAGSGAAGWIWHKVAG
jgi:hypothetical protein